VARQDLKAGGAKPTFELAKKSSPRRG